MKRLRELPAYPKATIDEDYTSEEEEQPALRSKKSLKSVMH